MSYSVPVNLIVILSFGIFVFYLLGIHNTLINLSGNGCEMTYMFEFPQFVEISLPSHVRQANPRYGLFGYGEGGRTEKLRQMKFKGIPVLFIPGSGGSYKQGRSLASVSLRKTLNSRGNIYFDYFMVDFNEEQSALYGGTLEQQTKFVRQCIIKILSFYSRNGNEKDKVDSVILIGHSVGGLIAKSVLVDPNFPKSYVKLIIALAAPVKAPVLLTDAYVLAFYQNLEKHWKSNMLWNDTTMVSIGGGNRDLLVRSDLTYDFSGHINVLTTAIPGVWSATDHLNIVWCKQLVLTVIRALFDCIDGKTKQVFADHQSRYEVFKYHLLKRSAGKKFTFDMHPRFVSFDKDSIWYENLLKQFSVVDHKGTKVNSYVMFRVNQEQKYKHVFVETINLNIKDWIFVCVADKFQKSVRICEKGENLSNMTEIAPVPPGSRLKRKFVYLNLFPYRIKNFTHVIVNIPKTDSFVQVNVDIHDNSSRNINYTVPGMYSMSQETIIGKTADNAVYYRINLNGFDTIWQGFVLNVETLSCKTSKNNAVVSFMIPWAAQHNHFYITDNKPLSVKLTLTSTRDEYVSDMMYPYITLNLEPSCNYKVLIQPSLTAAASQIVIYFTGVLPSYILTVLLLTLREQVLHLDEGESVFFHTALCAAVRRYYLIVQATVFGAKLFGLGLFTYVLPRPDFLFVEDFNMDYFLLSILMYGVAIIITYSSGIAGYVSVVIIGKTAHKMALKFVARTVTGFMNCSEWLISILHQGPILVSALLVSLAISTSGALSMCVGTIFYFLKISNMYEVYLEDMLQYSLKFIAQKVKNLRRQKRGSRGLKNKSNRPEKEEESKPVGSSSTAAEETDSNGNESDNSVALSESDILDAGLLWNVHFHISMFLLWFLITLLNLPSLLVWARNYHNKVFLENDPAVIPSIILHICGSLLWQPGVPHPCRRLSTIFSTILFILATLTVIYGSVSLYRLSYIISVTVIVLTVNQLMAKFSY